MKGAFITNRYYSDGGLEYTYNSLARAFGKRAHLKRVCPLWSYDKGVQLDFNSDLIGTYPAALPRGASAKADAGPGLCPGIDTGHFDFALFWDKDYFLASAFKKRGIRVFNEPEVLAVCDDKQKTYAALTGIEIPKTISAPLMYDVNAEEDKEFLGFVAKELGFPVIVKENTGSQGRQVNKADDMNALREIYLKLRRIPHHYQAMTGIFGQDLRVYVVGGEAVAACKRYGTDFRSNLGAGGRMELVNLPKEYRDVAESVARQLKLDYGSVDFLIADKPIFLEANSNAYFMGIEGLGVRIAEPLAEYVLREMTRIEGR
ncbi:MAG: hypothetical protein FWE84_06530 [Firmicutes bacterium]|nr:hypothetical protein [Bacillota bacterium]